MAHSIGIDIVEIERIRRAVERFGDRFIARILGPDERAALSARRDRPLFLAGRLAAKEAVIKALGEFITDRPAFARLEIINDATGRPHLHLPADLAERLPHLDISISISHEKNYAVAMALCWETS
jgi:holo-[acyl-carrier protein] synthase